MRSKIINGEFLQIELPLRSKNVNATLVPIDAVFQNENGATILVEENGIAVTKEITLGNIYGSFAEVTSSLPADTHIILSRSIINGDTVVETH
jgi:hypothetical protein